MPAFGYGETLACNVTTWPSLAAAGDAFSEVVVVI